MKALGTQMWISTGVFEKPNAMVAATASIGGNDSQMNDETEKKRVESHFKICTAEFMRAAQAITHRRRKRVDLWVSVLWLHKTFLESYYICTHAHAKNVQSVIILHFVWWPKWCGISSTAKGIKCASICTLNSVHRVRKFPFLYALCSMLPSPMNIVRYTTEFFASGAKRQEKGAEWIHRPHSNA